MYYCYKQTNKHTDNGIIDGLHHVSDLEKKIQSRVDNDLKGYREEVEDNDENINDLFKKHKVPVDVDLVVIDVDGQDYWIWKALEAKPRVVEIEFNTTLGMDEIKVMHRVQLRLRLLNFRI